MIYPDWIDAERWDPPYAKYPKSYLVILNNGARANHCKDFAGRGEPEIAVWCNEYGKSYKWHCRGGLLVAFWRPLPDFDMVWVEGEEGERPKWTQPTD